MAQPTLQSQQQVALLYLSMLNRNPEPEGFAFWVNSMTNGATQSQIASGMSSSPEFRPYLSLTPTQAVTRMYENILDRPTTPADGVAFWVNGIAGWQATGLTYAQSLGQIAVSISNAAFTQPSTSRDGAYVQASVATAIADGTAVPLVTYTLTTGVDTISDINNMDVEGTGTTFTPLDSITGTGFNNSLTIVDSTGASAAGIPAGVKVAGIQTANITSLGTIGSGSSSAVTGVAEVVTFTPTASSSGNVTAVTLVVAGVTYTTTGLTITTRPDIGTAMAALVARAFGGSVTIGTPDSTTGVFTVVAKATGTDLPAMTSSLTGGTGAAIANAVTTLPVTAVAASALAQIQTITLGGSTLGATDVYSVEVNGRSIAAYTGATQPTAAIQIAAQINALYGSDIATAVGSSITVQGAVGQVLPAISATVVPATAGGATATTSVVSSAATSTATGTVYDVSTWTGLTQFNANSFGGENIKAAATTSLALNDLALGAGSITTSGGNNIAITAAAQTTGLITVGTATASAQPTGAVSIASTVGTAGATVVTGAIAVNGGTSVSVAQTLKSGVTSGTVTQAAVTVNGSTATTAVTVNQVNSTTGAVTVVTAASGALYTAPATAAPGVTGVTAVTGQVFARAVVATAAVNQGLVQITDKNGASQTLANSISTVTLNGYANSSFITSSALTTLNVGGITAAAGATLNLNNNALVNTTTGTTLALNTTALSGAVAQGSSAITAGTINDATNTIEVVNLTNTGTTLFTLKSSSISTLSITGSGSVTLPVYANANSLLGLTSLTVSGAVSFSDASISGSTGELSGTGGLNTFGSALTITNTSTGNFTARLDAATQAYAGGGGNDTIIITADALKAITGGAGVDELVLGAGTFTAVNTGRNVSGFETLGFVDTASSRTVDVAQLFSNTFSTVNVRSILTGNTLTVDNVAQNAGITFLTTSATTAYAGSVRVNYDSTTGATDAVRVQIGSATNNASRTVNSLQVADELFAGIGTMNIVSNNTTQSSLTTLGGSSNNTAGQNKITTLINQGLTNLNVSGSGDFLLGTVGTSSTAISLASTALTINNTLAGTIGLTVAQITGNSLANLTFTGSNDTNLAVLSNTAATITLTNSGTGDANIATFAASSTLGTLNINGDIQLGGGSTSTGAWDLDKTTGITVNGATNDRQVSLDLAAAADGYANTVTLGNGNNWILDRTSAGDIVIVTGTGANLINASAGANNQTFSAAITFAADTDSASDRDQVVVSNNAAAVVTGGVVQTVITGLGSGDLVQFSGTLDQIITLSAADQATIAAAVSATAAATAAAEMVNDDATSGADAAASFLWNGNTYIIRIAAASSSVDALEAADALVQLVGGYTLSTTAGTGGIVNNSASLLVI